MHDACGVGFVAGTSGGPRHEILLHGLTALRRLTHRGAPASLGAVDGCGLLTAIPWTLVDAWAGSREARGRRALGMIFVHEDDRSRAAAVVERELRAAGARRIAWRSVPIDATRVLPAQRRTVPVVLQVIAGFEGRARVEAALYRARLRIERTAREDAMRLAIASLSTRTVVYKALVTPDALATFYPDLEDARFATDFVVFHQRFSTNTSADWALAQPFRVLAHNGEVNTISGNRLWMRARAADITSLPGVDGAAVVSTDGSDSRSLDDALELLRHDGYSLAHAMSRLVPPAWERDTTIARDVRAFYEFQSLLGEPWDGPSAVFFADGQVVGAALDRNGFRPARVVSTAEGLVAVASEVGVLAADEHEIVDRGRLGPGDMIVVDLKRGSVIGTQQLRHRMASRRPYATLLANALVSDTDARLQPSRDTGWSGDAPGVTLAQRQAVFGCTREEVDVILRPMIVGGHEAVGSMGDDAPPAVLSSRSRLFTDFFRQRFAQVTNPSVDPYRESSVMSLTSTLGAHGSYLDELAPRPRRIVLGSPILSSRQFADLLAADEFAPVAIDSTFAAAGGAAALERRLQEIADHACRVVEQGSALVVLTDQAIGADRAPLPAPLAMSAVHHALIVRGLRMRASLIADTGDARDAHQLAVLCAYGASAVHPSLGYATVAAIAESDTGATDAPSARYRLALKRGLLTILSKMGVCTFSSYCGAQLFEILGLDVSLVDRWFPGTPSPVGGATLQDVAATILERHSRAFDAAPPGVDYPGLHGYRRGGEYHAANPLVVKSLQHATQEPHAYATFTSHVYGRPAAAVRDLLEFAPASPIGLDAVESVDAICRRFFVSAMSVGALSPEAHRTIAAAMNRIGARSNSGEGGEEPDRFGCADGSRTKQVASARFGVTPAYLRSADELQIKIAQGSKPGEGGQLPGVKVVPHIARLRHAQPGTPLISPPVHHDIYSIEDLAELVHDLRAFNPTARINVKLVSSSGVGIIATGVAKAGAQAIQISGHDGGTGASPRGSIKHAGLPWEIGLSDAHRALAAAGLRHRVVLQTDGGLKTGRDVAMAAAFGADEYGFGTAALVALGCVMARQCHANTCPVGIATQREDLRADFTGTADMLVGYLRLVAGEVREILASLGLTRLPDLVGRVDLLRRREHVKPAIVLDRILEPAKPGPAAPGTLAFGTSAPGTSAPGTSAPGTSAPGTSAPGTPAPGTLAPGTLAPGTLAPGTLAPRMFISNSDRAFGADIAGAIAARHGDAGLPDGSIHIALTGSAGQSFGAFAVPGMRLVLVGDANDGVGKGMHGGEIAIAPAARERGRPRQVLVGNAALYGATGGHLFVAGVAGERFAVRNSGATAVVEGVGDHACEYMTGGIVVLLGAAGRNLAAGMTGGVLYAWDPHAQIPASLSQSLVVETPASTELRTIERLLKRHVRLTGSRIARTILRDERHLAAFRRVATAAAVVEAAAGGDAQAVNE